MITKNGYQSIARGLKLDERRQIAELSEALKVGEIKPNEFSIRKLAEHTIDDGREWVSMLAPGAESGYVEAAGSVSVGSFSNITGQIVYNRMLQNYQAEDFIFTKMVETIPTVFNGERIAGIGGIGDSATSINEGAPYPVVGLNENWIDTPQTIKSGMIIPITKEAIFFDRTSQILTRAAEIGTFLGYSKEKRIIDVVIDENTTAGRYQWKGTTYATYQGTSPWVNLKASNGLVDWTNIDAALLVASQIVDPNTGLPIVNVGSDMIVAQQLVATAARVLSATQVMMHTGGYATSGNLTGTASPNPIMDIPGYSPPSYKIRTSKLLSSLMGTKTNWYIGDVNQAFAYMENWPITVVQAPVNSEAEFTQDIVVRYKASERGAAATKDPRYMLKNTA